MSIDKSTVNARLQELGIYNEYYYRKEIKPLAQMLYYGEKLNCILTGVHEANRKMLVITDQRVMIIFSGALGSGDFKVIKRSAVTDWSFDKKLFLSKVFFTAAGEEYVFTNTQGSRKELFEWAMKQPIPSNTFKD